MKFSEAWLREWVKPELATQALVDQITMAGLEVDAVEGAAGEFSGVIVGEIKACEQHPDADKLRVCQVAGLGDELTQVVCGAPNAAVGLKIPFATVGAVLPGNFKIKKAKLRGVESFGMLCGGDEIGLSDDSAGLFEFSADAPVGSDVREYLQLDDQLIEVDLTPNRGDCLSIKGLAREVGVLNRVPLTEPEILVQAATIDAVKGVSLQAPADCPRYLGRIIKNVNVAAPTPLWMVEKLRRGGIRSIDAIVDVTNYVLLELGQPMHAFDLAKLEGDIQVRLAKAEEKLTLLDGTELSLKPDSLVIADQNKALALAGIMGGADSGVSANSTDIMLEAAFFAPVRIAGRARNFGLHTDSSHRFERGVDWQLQIDAMERATQLLLEIVGGQAGPVTEAVADSELPGLATIALRRNRIKRVLGFELADAELVDILERLGMQVVANAEGWDVTAPSYRFDVTIEADLLEELARVYGYNNLPIKPVSMDIDFAAVDESQVSLGDARRLMAGRGFQEAITYSFIDPKLSALFDPEQTPIALANPISAEMGVMRTSLLPGLCSALAHNAKRQKHRVRLFETGLRFSAGTASKFAQIPTIAGLIYGDRSIENWADDKLKVDFFDLKGDLEALLGLGASADFSFEAGSHPALHPGQTALVKKAGQAIGVIGALHPDVQKSLGLAETAYVFELDQLAVVSGVLPKFAELSKFPEVRRDLAIIINQELSSADIIKTVKLSAGQNLIKVLLFDVYQGKGIEEGKKSLALGMLFQHQQRTLEEADINTAVDSVVAALSQQYEAVLR